MAGKPKDRTGQKVGKLTFVKKLEKLGDSYQWLLICDCGNSVIRRPDNLTVKSSCGCAEHERLGIISRSRKTDLSGTSSGFLTYIKESPVPGERRILVRCVCGNEKEILAGHYMQGRVKSCGCYNKQVRASSISVNRIDISGLKSGKLTVLKLSHVKNGNSYWSCQCDCGEQAVIRGTSLKSGRVKSCGCLVFEKNRKGA